MKIILFANTDWYLYNFRLSLAHTLRDLGHEVILLSPDGEYGSRLTHLGFRWVVFPLSRRGMNPFHELVTIGRLARFYGREQPDIVHHFTVKCVLYGSLAARLARTGKVVNSITGLGYLFIETQKPWVAVLRRLILVLYRWLLKNTRVIFQNREDMALFLKKRLVPEKWTRLISGSGVDTKLFLPLPEKEGMPLVILPGRLLWDKGVGEFVEAAKRIKNEGLEARFALVGASDNANPGGVTEDQMDIWCREKIVECWGWRDDMLEVLAQAHIVCLPSYREGLPRALLEAGACARPVITTDAPGCREVVRAGQNGLLVPIKDPEALANALRLLIGDGELRRRMGARGRHIVVEEFSVERVNTETIKVYQES